ncbi:MAG: Ig-like domain repeat protein [Armatimonadia bacterium]
MRRATRLVLLLGVGLLLICSAGMAATLTVGPGQTYTTIQAAVNAAASGDSVEVLAGTYAENLNINKSLTLTGPNANINPNTGNRVPEAVITSGGGGEGIAPRANGITLEGFTFGSRGNYNIYPADKVNVSGLVVSRNIFSSGGALYTEGRLTSVTFTENRQVGGGTCFYCMDIDGASITDNFMKGMSRGVNIGSGSICKDVTISGNTFDTNGRYAIQMLIGIQNVSIENNEIINTTSAPNTSSYGIVVAGNGDFPGPLAITNNRISAADLGLFIADSSVAGDKVTVDGNTFNTYTASFIYFAGAGTLTALKTTNTYDGASDDAAIEAKVYHDVDNAAFGHVNWGQNGGAPATECVLAVSPVSGSVGQTVQLTAKLTAGGTPIPGQPVYFSVTGLPTFSKVLATTDAAGVAAVPYGPLTIGDKTITAKFSGVSPYKATTGTGTLTVAAAAPTAITLTVDPTSVASGGTATCTVLGDNGVDYTDVCTYYVQYGAGGSWANNVYTSAKAGTWNVTAVYNTLADTKPLTVMPGAAASVTLTPATATINPDATQEYAVTATDEAGNTWTPATGDITWAEDGAGSFAGFVYTPDEVGDAGSTVTITAAVGGVTSNAATLNVNAATGAGAILAWDKDTRKFYLCSNASDPQTGTEITGSGDYGGIAVTVSGTGTNVTVTAGGASLRVMWYLRSGSLYKAYQYSNGTSAGSKTATYDGRRTLVDGAWKTGFWGLTHTIDAGTTSYGSAEQ